MQLRCYGQDGHESVFCLKIEIAPNKLYFVRETGGH